MADLASWSALPASPRDNTYPALLAPVREAESCGIRLQKGQNFRPTFRVNSAAGARVVYKLDRWD